MKPLETMRFACGECLVVFDLQLAPTSEWAEGRLDVPGDVELPPDCCLFCGSSEIRALHDRPAR
jgi:hypothetical protein